MIPLASPDRELFQRAREGDQGARSELFERHLPLAEHLAARFLPTGADREDVRQVAGLGLIKAIDGFDPGRGTAFSTYAVPVILGEMKMYFRRAGAVHVTRGARDLARRASAERERLASGRCAEPTVREIARAMEVDEGELVLALEGVRPPLSLEEKGPRGEGSAIALLERLSGDDSSSWFERLALREALYRLDGQERRVLRLRYFEDKTQAETACELNLSQPHVSRLETRALRRLRGLMGGEEGEE